MNGQDHAHQAEQLLVHADEQYHSQEVVTLSVGQAQVHATLAVAYAQAGAWKDTPSPTAASLTCGDDGYSLGCCRARGHDGNHVAADGFDWADA